MKKTIALLLATAGMVTAAVDEVIPVFDEETQLYKLTNDNNQSLISGENVTVAITLNLTNTFTEDYSYLFTLNGSFALSEGTSSAEGMLLDKSGDKYKLKYTAGKVGVDKDPNSQSWKTTMIDGYESLRNHEIDLTSIQAISIILTVEDNGNTGTATGYVFIKNNEGVTKEYASFCNNNTINTKDITLLEYDEYLVKNISIYNGCLNSDQINELGNNLIASSSPVNPDTPGTDNDNPTIPEPTTATLSLLALAGLAARRRRK